MMFFDVVSQTLDLNAAVIVIMFIIILFSSIAFLLPVLGGNRFVLFKRSEWGFIFKTEFYKTPLRWISFLFLMILSLFRKPEKIYAKEALNVELSYLDFSDEFSIAIGKEKNYYYAVFVGNTVNYIQQVRYAWANRKDPAQSSHQGTAELFSIHADSYSLSPLRLERLEQIRYDFDGWLPSNKIAKFIDKESERYEYYLKYLEQQKENELKKKLRDLDDTPQTVVRNVVKLPPKRFGNE